MAFAPIALTIPQYEDFPNQYLKFYEPGATTTPKLMATDATGSTTLAKVQLSDSGFPTTSGAIFIPFVNANYDLWLFPTAAEADADDTINALRFAINIDNSGLGPLAASTGSSRSFDLAITAALQDLSTVSTFTTEGGLVETDNFGGTFGATGLTTIGKAGTVNIDDGAVYDTAGIQFKLIGNTIRLETLGLIYTSTATITLNHIIALRGIGFNVDVGTRYNLTDFERKKQIVDSDIEYIIHRCMGIPFPENTLLASSMSFNRTLGINKSMEVDVQITSDGIPICYHDQTLDTDTDGTGLIKNNTLAQVRAAILNTVAGTVFEDGVRIPTFDDFVRYCSSVGVKINAEIKEFRNISDIQIMNDVVKKYRYERLISWSSFNIVDLQELRKYNQQSTATWITESGYTTQDLEDLFKVGNVSISVNFNDLIATPSDIDVFHSYGFNVAAFTIQRAEQIQLMTDIGVNKIISDINAIPNTTFVSVASEQGFNTGPWTEVKTGAGTVVYTGNPQQAQTTDEVVTCEGNASSEATVNLAYNLSAGEWVQMTVIARNFGSHITPAQIDIDSPYGSRKETVEIISDDFIEYRASYQNVFTEKFDANQIAFVLGSVSTRDSGAQFYRPQIQSSNTAFGFRRCLMYGFLQISVGGVANTYQLHSNYNQFNVNTITVAGNSIEIRPTKEANTTAVGVLNGIFPTVNMIPSDTGMTINDIKFTARVNDPQGKVIISAFIGTVQQNISALTTEYRINFEVLF